MLGDRCLFNEASRSSLRHEGPDIPDVAPVVVKEAKECVTGRIKFSGADQFVQPGFLQLLQEAVVFVQMPSTESDHFKEG